MSVTEYRDKFTQLSHFAPNEVAGDADKQCRFLKGFYDGLQLQLMSNTYPNLQTLVNSAIVIDNSAKRWRLRRGGFRDRPLKVILVCAPTLNKASNRGTRGHLISGIVLSTHSVTSSSSVSRISSRVASRHHDREHLTTLP